MADFPPQVDFPCPPKLKAFLNQLRAARMATQPTQGLGTTVFETDQGIAINAHVTSVAAEACHCEGLDFFLLHGDETYPGADFNKRWCNRIVHFYFDGATVSDFDAWRPSVLDDVPGPEDITCQPPTADPIAFWFTPTADEVNNALDAMDEPPSDRTNLSVTMGLSCYRPMVSRLVDLGASHDYPVGDETTSIIYLVKLCYS